MAAFAGLGWKVYNSNNANKKPVSQNPTSTDPGANIAFTTIDQGGLGVNADMTNAKVTIDSREDWENFHQALYYEDGLGAPDNPRIIDFSKKTVVAVVIGRRGNDGTLVEITKITKEASRVIVHVLIRDSRENCNASDVITNPFHIVEFDKVNMPIEFETQTQTAC